VTIYDVSGPELVHNNGPPQVLQRIPGSRKRLGQCLYRHPASDTPDINFLELSAADGLFSTRLSLGKPIENSSTTLNPVSQNAHRVVVSQRAGAVQPEDRPQDLKDKSEESSRRESLEVDFSRVYQGNLYTIAFTSVD